jgi:hypothetical protein
MSTAPRGRCRGSSSACRCDKGSAGTRPGWRFQSRWKASSPTGRAHSGGRRLARSSFVSTSRRCASSAAIGAAADFTRRCWYGRPIPRCATTSSGRVRRRLVRDPEGRLQPHARQRPGQRPARRGVAGRGGRCGAGGDDGDVSIGGAGLAAAAFELSLFDELRMRRYPVVVGGGTPFLPPVTENVPLDLLETRTFGSRVIYERYRRARR